MKTAVIGDAVKCRKADYELETFAAMLAIPHERSYEKQKVVVVNEA